MIYCGKDGFGHISRSFASNSGAILLKRPENLTQIGFPSLRSVNPDRLLGCLRETACRTGHRNDNQAQPSLLRVMPFAVSEHYLELIGCPISGSLSTSCICLELRLLSSTSITRLLQYYEPLRHPKVPRPSLTGVRLTFPRSHQGVSRVACASLVYMLSPLPRHSD